MINPKNSSRRMIKLLFNSKSLSIFEARDLLLLNEQAFKRRTNSNYKNLTTDPYIEVIDNSHFTWLESLDIDGLLVVNALIKNTYLISNLIDRFTPENHIIYNINDEMAKKTRFEKSTRLNIDLSRDKLICNVIAYFDLELSYNNLLKESHVRLLQMVSISIYNNTKYTLNWIRQQLKDLDKASKFEASQWFFNKLKDKSAKEPTEYLNDDNLEQFLNFFVFSSYISRSEEGFELEVRKIKSAWSSKKNRDSNNDKKACSHMLSIKTIEQLEELRKVNRRRKNEMLEILIEDAWKDMRDAKKPIRR